MMVKLLHCLIVQSGVNGLIIGFTHIVVVKYVTNTHVFKQGILRQLLESGQNLSCCSHSTIESLNTSHS